MASFPPSASPVLSALPAASGLPKTRRQHGFQSPHPFHPSPPAPHRRPRLTSGAQRLRSRLSGGIQAAELSSGRRGALRPGPAHGGGRGGLQDPSSLRLLLSAVVKAPPSAPHTSGQEEEVLPPSHVKKAPTNRGTAFWRAQDDGSLERKSAVRAQRACAAW